MIPALHRKRHTQQSFIRSLCVCLDGLPERIRTFDLQSRSLTRYPAVPRVDFLYLSILSQKSGLVKGFLKKVKKLLFSVKM